MFQHLSSLQQCTPSTQMVSIGGHTTLDILHRRIRDEVRVGIRVGVGVKAALSLNIHISHG